MGARSHLVLQDSWNKNDLLREQHLRFLEHFDRILPNHFLCPYCHAYHKRNLAKELHKRAEADAFDIFFNNEPACPRFIDFGERHFYRGHGYSRRIYWECARLVLRAHKFGPAYGVGVESLDCDFRHAPQAVKNCIQTRNAKLINGRLVLRFQAYFPGPQTPASRMDAEMSKHIAEFVPMADIHWDNGICDGTLFEMDPSLLLSLRQRFEVSKKQRAQTRIHRCADCPTDAQLSITTAHNLPDIARRALEGVHGLRRRSRRGASASQADSVGSNFPVIIATRWIDYGCGGVLPSWEYRALHQGDCMFDETRAVYDIAKLYKSAPEKRTT